MIARVRLLFAILVCSIVDHDWEEIPRHDPRTTQLVICTRCGELHAGEYW